jgi:hypothetical protein
MNYVIQQTAAAVVAAASDFVMEGRAAIPAVPIEGPYSAALASQMERDRVAGSKPMTVVLLNTWPVDARVAWLMNNFETDERYAHARSVAQTTMVAEPIDFPLEIERRWQKRATKDW